MNDEVEIENSRMLRMLSEQAGQYRNHESRELSYDSIATDIIKGIDWSLTTDLSQNIDYFFSKESYLRRTHYYYSQLIKAMADEDQIDLTSSAYIDFWNCISSIETLSSLNSYRNKILSKKDYFPFLRSFRIFVEDSKYNINFKIKVLKVLKIRLERKSWIRKILI